MEVLMKILQFPDPRLFTKCEDVSGFGPELLNLLNGMWQTMTGSRGIGLAANQIGVSIRAFTMLGPNNEKLFIVNPKIIKKSEVPANLKEGCLSAKGEFLILDERVDSVDLEYQNETGEKIICTFTGIYAVCCQHEIQHLDGESFLQSKSLSRQLRRQMQRKWGV
jgi:peptide deformylase